MRLSFWNLILKNGTFYSATRDLKGKPEIDTDLVLYKISICVCFILKVFQKWTPSKDDVHFDEATVQNPFFKYVTAKNSPSELL